MIVAQLKNSLETKKAELSQRLQAIEADFKKGRSQDFAEQGSECENDQVLDGIHQQTITEIAKINDTLALLNTEQYGICQQCGEAITEQRLIVMPATNLCINCAD
ncbi:TraR/DksA family transcriptional regulator [Colwelliaceae bacterium BS250]